MNIVTILNKLKESSMVSDTEDGMSLFSDCFTKFGISLLLLNDENKFNGIVDLLKSNGIPLQKANGIYALRIFAVELSELENLISTFQNLNEIEFLRYYPELLAEPKNIHSVIEQIKYCQTNGISYKTSSGYLMSILLPDSDYANQVVEEEITDVNEFLKRYLKDTTLIDRLVNGEATEGEEDFNIALELQKVENKICEEFLFPVDDGWKIVINNKEVNSFQEVKNTISTITKLNLSISFNDALLIVLFYKTNLTPAEVSDIIENVLLKEEV